MNAKTFAAVKGVKHIPLTLGNVMLPDDLNYIQKNFNFMQLQSVVIRVQVQEIQRPFQYTPTPTGAINAGTVNIGGAYTPRIYMGLFGQEDLTPSVPASNSDADINAVKPEWLNCPKIKSIQSNKITSFYWNCPKPNRSGKITTANTAFDTHLFATLSLPANQKVQNFEVFWADLNKYYYTLTSEADNTTIILNLQYVLLFKLSDSTTCHSTTE